jgi:hypothetical protein
MDGNVVYQELVTYLTEIHNQILPWFSSVTLYFRVRLVMQSVRKALYRG